jgi:nuclear-control-of-ATPase protein 2|eukprot:evm.model.NODE_7315_length_18975_cov_30.659973.5
MSHKKARPEALSRLGSVTDLVSLRNFQSHSLIDHRHKERFRHKRILDALNVQTRQGIPIQRSLAKLQAEAEKILHDRISLSDDETQIFVASLAECLLRICLESELDLSGSLYWDCLFWQDRIASPLAAWLEAGPFTWFQDEDEALTPEDKLESSQRLMGQINVGTGLIQQHLTRKIVNTDVMYLAVWSQEALTLIDDILDDDFETPGRLNSEHSGRLLLPDDASPSTSASDLRECMARLANLRARIASRAARFQTLVAPLHAPSFWRRRWLYVLIATPFVVISFKWFWGKRGDIPLWVAQAVQSTREFFTEHVSEPSRAIFKELIWNEHESITDVAALEDAKQSLTRMLADFVKDTNPKLSEKVVVSFSSFYSSLLSLLPSFAAYHCLAISLPSSFSPSFHPQERKKLAESMDMSVVSSRYEQTLPQAMKHIVSGEIVRMLLIQVQFIKKELLVAMRGIDDVMNR